MARLHVLEPQPRAIDGACWVAQWRRARATVLASVIRATPGSPRRDPNFRGRRATATAAASSACDDGGHAQGVIGMMMAFHIWGMYLFSPVVGWLTDRYGQYPMLYVSGILCTWGAVWAAVTPPAGLLGVFMGNFLIGMGWCFGVIAASSLIVGQFSIEHRVSVQGVSDLAMVGSGALAGVSSGLLFELFGYGGVNTGNAIFGAMLILATAGTFFAVRRRHSLPMVTTG